LEPSAAPNYLDLEVVKRYNAGLFLYNWDIKIKNSNNFWAYATFNSKMCFEGDAKGYLGLYHLITTIIPPNGSITVRIDANGTAGWISTAIYYEMNGKNYMRITCANNLKTTGLTQTKLQLNL